MFDFEKSKKLLYFGTEPISYMHVVLQYEKGHVHLAFLRNHDPITNNDACKSKLLTNDEHGKRCAVQDYMGRG